MDYPGTVQGEAARLYAGFTYRKPVIARVDAWQLDPERLHPAHEYPRSVNPPTQPNTQAVELADYVVRIGASGDGCMSPVQVWMQPNEYTAARKPLLVYEFKVSNALTLRHEYRAEAERLAFVKPNVAGKRPVPGSA
jgi:hypothetical protein